MQKSNQRYFDTSAVALQDNSTKHTVPTTPHRGLMGPIKHNQRNDRTEHQQQLLRIPTDHRQTSWLFASAALKLNQGLPRTNSTSGQNESPDLTASALTTGPHCLQLLSLRSLMGGTPLNEVWLDSREIWHCDFTADARHKFAKIEESCLIFANFLPFIYSSYQATF